MADELARNYRRAALSIRAAMIRDLITLWPMLDRSEIDAAYPSWARLVSALVQRDRVKVAGLASAYLRAARAESGVSGAALVIPATTLSAGQFDAALSTTARAGYFKALAYYPPDKASDVNLVRTAGAMSRLVLNGGRQTITDSLRADPKGVGWRRLTSPGACDFCILLAGRGAVYSAATADFAAHDWCACSVVAEYSTHIYDVLPYEPSKKRRSAEARARDNQRVRDFIAG